MKHWKSLISLTLTLSMVLSLFSPVAVFAQEAAAPELSVESPAETPAEIPAEEPAEETSVQEPEEAAPALDAPEEGAVLELLASSNLCGANLTWTLDADGVLTISGTGDMYDYQMNTQPWYSDRAAVKKIVVEEGVTSLGDYAFYACNYATEVQLPTTLTAIGSRAFQTCQKLKVVTIPGTITEWGSSAFGNCAALTTFSLTGCTTAVPMDTFDYCTYLTTVSLPEGVTSIGSGAFDGCTRLAVIDIPSTVTYISSNAFNGCAALTSVVIPDGCRYIDTNAFSGCMALETVDLGSGLGGIYNHAFYGCAKITELTLPDTLTHIDRNAFYACNGLESVDFGEGIQTLGDSAFYGCTGLTGLVLPDSLQTISANAFRDCINVQMVDIGSGIRTIGDAAFGGCSALATVDVDYYKEAMTVGADAFPAAATVNYKAVTADTVLFTWTRTKYTATLYGDGRLVVEGSAVDNFYGGASDAPWYSVRDQIRSVIVQGGIGSIGSYAFAECTNLTQATIADSVTSIGAYAFSNCSALQTVSIDNYDFNVTVGSGAFPANASVVYRIATSDTVLQQWVYTNYTATLYGDGRLVVEGSAVDNFNSGASYTPWYSVRDQIRSVVVQEGIGSIGDFAFAECTNLTQVTIADSVTSIGDFAFWNCTALETVTIGSGMENIGDSAFSGCSALTAVTIDNYAFNVTVASDAFPANASVTYRTIAPDTVVESWDKGSYAAKLYGDGRLVISGSAMEDFDGASYTPWYSHRSEILTVIVEDGVARVGKYAFAGLEFLTEVQLPASVTEIGWYAFADCYHLPEMTIPDGVETIGGHAFRDCFRMTSLDVGKGLKTITNDAFYGCYGLTGLELPDSLETIESRAFYGCSALQTLTIGSGIKSIGSDAFTNCSSLNAASLDVYQGTVQLGSRAFPAHTVVTYRTATSNTVLYQWEVGAYDETTATATLYADGRLVLEGVGEVSATRPWNNYKALITSVHVGDGITELPSGAFQSCSNLKTVTGMASLKVLPSSAFYMCYSLESIALGSGLTTIENSALRECTSLTSVVLPDTLKKIYSYAFFGNTALTEITIPDSVSQIEESAFSDCTALKELTVGSGLSYLYSQVFYNCTALETINWNAPSPYINSYGSASATHIFYNAGIKGSGITVNLGKAVKAIPNYLFYVSSAYEGCQPKIKNITLADDGQLTTIGNFSFYRLTQLESVELGDKLTTIGDGAFNTCSALTEVSLPDTVTTIGARAFYRNALKSVTLSDGVTKIGENAFGEISDPDFTIYGEAGSTAHTYAVSENIPFNAYVRSGSQDGIDWTYDEQTKVLTLNGSGASVLPVQSPQWERYLNNAAHIIIGSGITTLGAGTVSADAVDGMQGYTLAIGEDVTEIAAGAFAGMTLKEVTFKGDQPAVTGGTSPFDSGVPVFYPAAASWTDFSWDGCAFYPLTGQNVTLTLYDNFPGTTRTTTITVEGGRPVSLDTYGQQALSRYQQSRPDAYLKGWNTLSDGTGTSHASGETITFTQNTTLYAQWPAYYTVKLEENNGLGSQTFTVQENKYFPLYSYYSDAQNRYQQTMPGATLANWNTVSDGSGSTYSPYSGFTVTGDIVLYAQWNLPAYVSVTLYDNNEYYPDKSDGVARHIAGNDLSLTAYTENAQTRRRLYDLTMAVAEWNTAADGSGTSYASDATINPTADLVLYARWDLAADQVIASGDDGDVHWELYSFGTLIVSGTGEMSDYGYRGAPWYSYRSQIKKVVVESGVTAVGYYAFYDCTALTEVSLPDTLTYIGSSAFSGCSALQTVTIDTFRMLVNCNYTFADTVSVTWKTSDTQPVLTWDISEEDDEGASAVNARLYSNGLLEISGKGRMEIDWHGSTTPWYDYRSYVEEVRVLSGVTNVGYYAFYYCENLTTVSLPDTLTHIARNAFYNCNSLTAVNIDTYELMVTVECTFSPNTVVTWKTAGGDNTVLKVWHVGEIDETDITATLYANGHLDLTGTGNFEATPWPRKITSVTISEGITNVAWGAFSGCPRLTEVSLPSTLTYIGGEAFYNCIALKNITIPATVQEIGEYAFFGCTALESIALPQTLTYLGSAAFRNCTALTTVTGLEQLEAIRSSTFRGCSALTTVSDLLSARYVSNYAFKDCTALQSITFGNALGEIYSQAFYNCTALTAVHLCEGITEIGDQAFENCAALTALTLPDSVAYVDYRAFAKCTALKTLTVGSGLYQLNSQVFADCTALTDIYWNAKNCHYLNESYFAFYNAGAAEGFTFTVGDGVEVIPAYLFYTSQLDEGKHPRLKTVRLAGTSALKQVGDFAFYRCLELDSVQLGDKVTHILQGAFNTCSSLTEIKLPACLQHVGKKAFFRTGLTEAGLGWYAREIGVEAFAECGAGFALKGYSGSFAQLYAQQYSIPFAPFETSGTDNGVSWSLDPASGRLTFTGSGTITTDGGWVEHALPVTGIVVGEGITGLENGAFDCCTNLQTVLFQGAPPALTEPSCMPFNPVDAVYCLDGVQGWDGTLGNAIWWNGLFVQVISAQITTLNLTGSVHDFTYHAQHTGNVGMWVDLNLFSRDLQNRYYATASDANLVSWNTAPDGSGNGYDLTDRFAMGDADTLYAQWEVPTDVMLTLNGNGCSWNQVYWQLSGSQVSLSALSTEVEQYYRNHMQAGAVLTGWNTRADGGGTAYAPTDSFIPLYNITLYAQWQLPEATEVASGEYGDGLKWTLNSHGQLTVTGTGDMPDGSRPWNRYQDRIASVVIGEGITRVGSYAFDGYHAITAVTLPDSLVSIGYDAFWNCSLTSVTLGSSIRSVEPGAFMNCSTPFTVYGDVSQVLVDYVYNDPHGNYASFPDDTVFYWEEGSNTEVVGKWEVGSYDETDVTATLYASGRLVIQGKGAFDKSPWSRRITSVEIGEGITAIGNNVFDGCTELTTVTTPRSLVKVGNYAFRNCYALKKVSDLSNVTYFGWYAFYNCSMLTSADLASAEEIQHYAFYNAGIDEAELDSIRYIDTEAFRNCKNLRSVIIGEELEWLGEQVFADCPVLQYVDWMCANELDLYAESNLFLNSGKEIQSIKDNAGIILYAYTEHIPAYLFYTSAELAGQEPNLVQVITKDNSRYATPVTIGEFAFYRAVHLKQVSPLPEVQSIGDGAFNSCEALTEITVGDSLHTLGAKAFFRTGLTSFASGRSLETIGENAFGQCSEDFFLQGYPDSALHKYADEYAIPFVEMNTSGQLGDISWSFEEATGTLTLTGNGKVTAAPWEHLASQVEHIVLSEGITLLDEGVFAGMEVEELVFPASLATLCADFIGNVEHAFFLGAAPEVDVDSEPVELPFHYAYYLQNTPGWSSCGWENDLYPFENRQGTMTLKEVTDDYSLDTPVTGYVGKKIALKAYSSLAQGRYDEEYGFGMTVSAWTDGTTRYAFNAVITLQDGLTLTAAWESVKFTVDGVEYPANTAASGTGWSYDGDTLTLNGYNGGGIEFPGDVDIVAQGTNTVSDGIFAEGELYLVVESGNTTVIRSSDDRKGYALDSDYLYLEVKEGAALNVSSAEGRAIYSAGNIYLNCDGTLNVTSANYSYAVYTPKRIYLSGSGIITAQGAKQALYGKTEVVFRSGFDIYLSADATEPAAEYATTPYLRLEGSKWSMTLHANGGTWGDGSAAGKVVTATSGGDIYLGEYSYLLTREGYVLTGWTDEGNTMEFTLSDDVYFEGKEVTLYAVWEKDALTVDGKTFAIDAPASGNGWSYTPAEGKNRANLTISEGYSGKPVAFTRALDVVITADTVITGTAGVPGISALGALRLTVEDADVTVTGGSGQHAVYTGGLLYLYNYGRTTLTGGAGGSGIYANYVQFYSYAGSALTATGGTRASAVWTETFRLQEASGIITLVGGDGRIAVDCGHWTCSGEPRFYAGENAADLFRAENLWDANDYAYFRIQPKLVVVNMDANGGAINGSMTATLSLLQAEDNSFLLLSGAAPVREGYLFTGWNTRADGSGTAYQDGESYTVREDATLNLFAQWEELPAPEASFGTGTAGQPQLTVEIPETLPEAAKESTVLAVCYDRTTGQMLASAFGTEKSTQWVFDIAQKENARWMLFFLKDVSHAPAFSNLELKIQQ